MRGFLFIANGLALVFSLVWLISHSTVRTGDWEFWFALGYLCLAALNMLYMLRKPNAG